MIHDAGCPYNASLGTGKEEAVLLHAESIIYNFVIPGICLFGILCNVLNLIILTRQHMKESPYTYLMGLAVADLSVLSLSLVESVFSRNLGKGIYTWKIFDAFVYFPVANFLATASVWVTVFLTIERFISVRFPLHAKDICTKELARKVVTGIFAVALAVNIPRFFCLYVLKHGEEYILVRTHFEETKFYKAVTWFYISTVHLIPLVTLFVLNICLLLTISRAHRQRTTLYQHKHDLRWAREQRRLTITCISIIFLFIICILPSAFSHRSLAVLLFHDKRPNTDISTSVRYRLLRIVTNTLVFCNLSLNFVLYCVFNNKFTTTFKYLWNIWMWKMMGSQRPESPFRRLSSITSSDKSLTRLWGYQIPGLENSHDRRKSSGSDSYTSSDLYRLYRCPASAEQSLRRISDLRRQTISEEDLSGDDTDNVFHTNQRRLSDLPSEDSDDSCIYIGRPASGSKV